MKLWLKILLTLLILVVEFGLASVMLMIYFLNNMPHSSGNPGLAFLINLVCVSSMFGLNWLVWFKIWKS